MCVNITVLIQGAPITAFVMKDTDFIAMEDPVKVCNYSQFHLIRIRLIGISGSKQLYNFHFQWERSTVEKLCNCLLPEILINQSLIK